MTTLENIIMERDKATKKCNVLAIEYNGSELTKLIMTSLIDYLPESMSTIVNMDYHEGTYSDGKSLNKLVASTMTWVDDREQIFKDLKVEDVQDCEIMRFELWIRTTEKRFRSNSVISIGAYLYVIRERNNTSNNLSILKITIGSCEDEEDYDSRVGTSSFSMWVIGNSEVEKALNREDKVYLTLLGSYEKEKNRRDFNEWDMKKHVMVQKTSHRN